MSEVMNLIPFMSEIMKLNSIHVRNFETNSIHVRKFDFDPHFHGKIYYDNKHRMIKIFNLQGILILNITIRFLLYVKSKAIFYFISPLHQSLVSYIIS